MSTPIAYKFSVLTKGWSNKKLNLFGGETRFAPSQKFQKHKTKNESPPDLL